MIVFVLMAIGLCQAPPEAKDFSSGTGGEKIVAWVESFEPHGFTGSVLAARDRQVVAAVGTGSADLQHKVPVTPATSFFFLKRKNMCLHTDSLCDIMPQRHLSVATDN